MGSRRALEQADYLTAVLPPLPFRIGISHHFVVALVCHVVRTCIVVQLVHAAVQSLFALAFCFETLNDEFLQHLSLQNIRTRREKNLHFAIAVHPIARVHHGVSRRFAAGVERAEQKHAVAHPADEVGVGSHGKIQRVASRNRQEIVSLFFDRDQAAQGRVVAPKIERNDKDLKQHKRSHDAANGEVSFHFLSCFVSRLGTGCACAWLTARKVTNIARNASSPLRSISAQTVANREKGVHGRATEDGKTKKKRPCGSFLGRWICLALLEIITLLRKLCIKCCQSRRSSPLVARSACRAVRGG